MSRHVANGSVRRPAHVMGQCEIEGVVGVKPRGLFTIRTDNKRLRKAFREFCSQWGIVAEVAQPHGDADENGHYQSVTFDCFGSVAALNELRSQLYVIRVEYVLSARVGQIACGTGPEKIRSHPASGVRPRTYADAACLERHDYRNSNRPASVRGDRGAWIGAKDVPAGVAPDYMDSPLFQDAVIAQLMRLHPSARFAD